ncbi:hypothetical protein EV361DRAFT_803666 [Lentinula raphanica]|nr:hypothetical protein EV361DRAFT_803666 [Lentinula raphanica]
MSFKVNCSTVYIHFNLVFSTKNTEHVLADIRSQFHHAPVQVPKNQNPFSSEDQFIAFKECLADAIQDDLIPAGFGVKEDEWENEGYPVFEILKSGRRGTKELRIPLPIEHWLPKAEVWVQGLVLMHSILAVDA